MSTTVVDDPADLLVSLGSLHDVRIERVCYESDANRLRIKVWDLNWNAEREPGYVARPCDLVFSEIRAFSIVAGQDRFHTTLVSEGVIITEAYAISKEALWRMDAVMHTSERWYVEFGRLEIEDMPR